MKVDQFPLTDKQMLDLQLILVQQTRVCMQAIDADLDKTWSLVVILHPNPDHCSIKVISA